MSLCQTRKWHRARHSVEKVNGKMKLFDEAENWVGTTIEGKKLNKKERALGSISLKRY